MQPKISALSLAAAASIVVLIAFALLWGLRPALSSSCHEPGSSWRVSKHIHRTGRAVFSSFDPPYFGSAVEPGPPQRAGRCPRCRRTRDLQTENQLSDRRRVDEAAGAQSAT